MTQRRIFQDTRLQEAFDRLGYVVVPGISEMQLQQMVKGYQQLPDANPTDFESTMNSPSPRHKQQVHELIAPVAAEIAGRYLHNYQPVIGNFVVKQPSPHSAVPPHQDWTMCDEHQYAGVNIWTALTDMSEANGGIYILPGSHRLPFCVRGNFIPAAFDSGLFPDHQCLTPVFLKAGESLIYDLRCIHCSPPNRSDAVRMAAGCACIPAEAEPLHFFLDTAAEKLTAYRASADFYFHYAYGVNRVPEGAVKISETAAYLPVRFERDIQEQMMDAQTIALPGRPPFRSADLQRRYEEDGYVLLDFLSEAEVQQVLHEFDAHTGWFSQGFMSSVYAPQEDYREFADRLLRPLGERLVKEYMPHYRVVIGTFMVKGAGEQSAMYPHQDWTLVDEHRYASFNIWIPLVDTTRENGAMSIMKGGHKMPFTMRGSNVPDALADKSQFTPDKLTYMPMKAGQALVYDHRCIHVSPPNLSGKLRPAIAIGIVPAGVEVFHYFFDKEAQRLRRYKADKEFYFRHVATQFDSPKEAELIDETPAPEFHTFTPEELRPLFARQEKPSRPFWKRIFSRV